MRTSVIAAGTLAGVILTLSACAAEPGQPAPDLTPTPTQTSAPSPSSAEAPISERTVLAIDSTASAPDGATLDLAMRVHQSLPADDPEMSELRSLLIDACGPDFVMHEKLDADAWGLVRIGVTARSTSDESWPSQLAISTVTAPRGELGAAAITSSGTPLTTPTDPAGELGPCLVPQGLTGEGEAYLVLGIRNDFFSDDAQGVFWNGYQYGFSDMLFGDSSGVEFSDCEIVKTPLGEELSAPEIGYSETDTASECSAGIPPVS